MPTYRTRRDFLKLSAAGVAGSASAAGLPTLGSFDETSNPGEISVWVTNEKQRFAQTASLSWKRSTGTATRETITLNPKKRFQKILGFGAAFTDASCFLFSQLASDARERLLHELFHPSELGLNVCRTCIGSSDYSTEVFSFDEGEPDPDLKRFSIEHDRAYVLPTLREARKINPDLFLFSSPWSPPGWMKPNGSMLGGSMRKRHFASYAQYFVKFLKAYAGEGVPIQAITSQNEVDTDQDGRMPACLWGQEYEIEFVKAHLGPALKASGLPTKIWLLDHNYNLWGRVICSLDDPDVRKFCNAIAWHGYVGTADMMSKAHDAHPDAEMYWTEGGPDYTSPTYATEWGVWGKTFTEALRNWCQSATGWNLVLDEQGRPNIGPFSCGGLVTVHSKTKEITRSGQYWAFAHFARAIRRNAERFESEGTVAKLDHVACENPDGKRVLIVTNGGPARSLTLRQGDLATELALEGDSLATLVWK
jgi:glucosylceramidase